MKNSTGYKLQTLYISSIRTLNSLRDIEKLM